MMQLRFRCARYHPEHARDFVVAIPLHVVQHEYLPGALGESGERFLEIE